MIVRTGIFGAALAGVCLLALSGCSKPEAQATEQMPSPMVTVAPAVAKDVPVYLDEIGKCSALESVTVRPQVAGRIVERDFEDGADLKKGQVLFKIDPRPFKAAVDSAKAQLAQAKAARELAKIQLQMYSAVADTRAVSKSDFDTKKNAVDVADAQVAAAEAAIETAQVNLDYCEIHSPIDGRAGARLVDAGNVVEANTTSLLLIQHLDPIYADFTITERDLPQVQKQMAQGTLKTQVRLPSDSESDVRTGNLIFLDNAVQDGSGTVRLRAQIPNSDHHFWPGQFVNVRLILVVKPAVLVPATATQVSQQGLFVFKVVADEKSPTKVAVMQQPVKLGQKHGDLVVIDSGLSAGDQVVTAGQMMLQPGSPVTIANPSTPSSNNDKQASAAASTEGSRS
ncbi:MAG TPA: efflux RND transporter periplasmic adaptor subunit [Tepidisphaeraceae bacterium]|nr:efflux RND transporter periplasmic adaptor subunit [Tepidisphaeraceae bacterium]